MGHQEPELATLDQVRTLFDTSGIGGTLIVDEVLATAAPVVALQAELSLDLYVHSGEPKEAQVDAMASRIRANDQRPVLAIGGGAVMDAAKAAASIAAGEYGAAHYQLGAHEMPMAKCKVVCVPTTSGTGSEVTRVSIVSDAQGHKKWMYGDALWPSHVLLMPTLTHSVPPFVKLFCGLDAMVHALEAATGKNSNAEIVARAAQSIPTILDVLADSVAGDPEADRQMQVASLHAGRAIDLGGTTIGHCLGHALGTVCGVPHGKAVTLATQVTLETCVRATPDAFRAVEDACDRGSMLDCWQGLIERLGTSAFGFESSAKDQQILESALSDENQPMRNTNVHWFDDNALADAISALTRSYRH